MKNRIKYIAVFFIFIAGIFNLKAQDMPCAEKIFLFSDRGLYVPGEDVFFRATSLPAQKDVCLSRILYLEMISVDGTSYNRGKYVLENGVASGRLNIPEGLISGNYYLKAYTRRLREEGPSCFFYSPLKIVSPVSQKILKPEENVSEAAYNSMFTPEAKAIEISTRKSSYNKRETVMVEYSIPDSLEGPLCLSVVPADAAPGGLQVFRDTLKNENADPGASLELDAVHLTGQLRGEEGNALVAESVNLSVPGEKDFISVYTDSAGNFTFHLPLYQGRRDMFLSAAKSGEKKEILVDNDFAPMVAPLPSYPFRLDSAENGTALMLARNQQLNDIYFRGKKQENDSSEVKLPPFYGKPTDILEIEKYIDLPTLADFFMELILPAGIKRTDEGKYLHFFSTNPDMILNRPLVLIDWIAIDDDEKILRLSPQKIDRIEFVNAPYVKGVKLYGGIISVISKEGDFGGIDLPSSGIFLDYSFPEEKEEPAGPPRMNNIPDVRNTLAWEPEIAAGQKQYSFITADTPGKYMILLRAVLKDGSIAEGSCYFEVR